MVQDTQAVPRVTAAALLAALALATFSLPAGAASGTRPATAPGAAAGSQRIQVTEVTGRLTVISTDNGTTWKPVTVGMEADPGAIFRTGPRSSITCLIQPGDQRFTVESLTKMTVAEASRRGNRARTDLVMDRGAVRYDIQAAGAEYESTVRTPSSTLAVRGTRTFVEDRVPFEPFAVSYTGVVEYTTAQRTARFGGRRAAAVRAGDGSAAQTALNETVVDPSIARARTNAEAQLIADQTSRGGILRFDPFAGLPVVRGGAPQSDAAIANPANQPGRLSLFLRWSGRADLNSGHTVTPVTPALVREGRRLAIDNPVIGQANLTDLQLGQVAITFGGAAADQALQEVLYPGFDLNRTRSGGRIPFDHRGGPRGGQEVAFWVNAPPPGVYGVGVLHVGGKTTNFKLDAFLDGEPLYIFSTEGVDANGVPVPVKSQTLRGRLPVRTRDGRASFSDGGIIYVPPNPFFESITADASEGQPAADPQDPQAVARRLVAEVNAKAARDTARATAPSLSRKPRAQKAAFKAPAAPARTNVGAPRVTRGGGASAMPGMRPHRQDLRVTGPRGR